MMNDYTNQARNAISEETQQVLIVFDIKMSRKASRYLVVGEKEKENILNELKDRNAHYIIGNDIEGDKSVAQAYAEAITFLESNSLYNPCGENAEIKTFAEAFNEE